jgi:hypothetical protein
MQATQAVKDIEIAGSQCVVNAAGAAVNAIEIASSQCNTGQGGGEEGNSLSNNSEIKVLNIV